MSKMLTRFAMSRASPTAPLYVKEAVGRGVSGYVMGQVLATIPSVVAGSPGRRGTVPGYIVLNTAGNSVPGRPLAMSASPDSGPKENMNVCVPLAIVEYPSPPETCWHLIAPLTFAFGTTYPPPVPDTAVVVNVVGPV